MVKITVTKRPAAETMQRSRQAAVQGLRQTVEGTAGMVGDAPGMVGGAVKWGLEKLPDQLVSPGQAAEAGGQVGDVVRTAGKAVSGGYAADVILKALEAAGIINPETSASIRAQTEPPTSEEVHGMTSAVLPESVNTFTQGPENPTPMEQNITFGTGMLGNLIGGNKIEGIKDIATRLFTRVGAPLATENIVSSATDRLVKEGTLSPENATAIKIASQMATGGGAGMMEKALAKRAAAKLADTNPAALREVYEALVQDGMAPDQARAEIAKLGGARIEGGEAMIADLGEHGNVEQLGIKAGKTQGTGGADLKRKLEERSESAGERIRAGQHDIMPPVNRDRELELFDKRSARIGGQYNLAKKNQARPVDTEPIAHELESEMATARGGTLSNLQSIRKNLDIPSAPGDLDPSAEGLHSVRKELDRKIEVAKRAGEPIADLVKYRKLVDAELKDAAPDIRRLDERLTKIKREEEAYLTGEQGPRKPVEGAIVPSDAEFKTTWDAMEPREQAAMRRGTSRWLDQQTGMVDRERVKLQSALSGDWNEAKLRTQFGDEKIDSLKAMLKREDVFQERRNKIVHGSKTATATDQTMPSSAGESAMTTLAATASPTSAAKAFGVTTAKNWLSRMLGRTNADQRLKSDIGKLLASDAPEDVFRAMEMLKKADSTAIMPRAMQTALMARMNETGHR